MNVIPGAAAEPSLNVMGPVIGVCPSAATDPVRASAMSLKSLLTAAELIVVPGTKAASGSEYDPEPLRGIDLPWCWRYRRRVKFLQWVTVLLVCASGAEWQWCQNPRVTFLIGVTAAYSLTGIAVRVQHWRAGLPPPPVSPFHSNLSVAGEVLEPEPAGSCQARVEWHPGPAGARSRAGGQHPG